MLNFTGMSEEAKRAIETPFALTEEKRNELKIEIATRLNYFDGLYHPDYQAICMMLDRWARDKSQVIRMFEQSPFYNGNFQIVFPAEYERGIDYDAVEDYLSDFTTYCRRKKDDMPEVKIGAFTYGEIMDLLGDVSDKLRAIDRCIQLNIPVDKAFLQTTKENQEFLHDIYNNICVTISKNMDKYKYWNSKYYDKGEFEVADYWYTAVRTLNNTHKTLTNVCSKDIAHFLNTDYPGAKTGKNQSERTLATEGQKFSRIIKRMAKETGFDQTEAGSNENFVKFADAINPLNVTRWTVLSVHPLDFYNMSNGNSWRSCHTIDKNNKDQVRTENHYGGMYSGGTGSYMEDKVSFVYYTVNPKVNEKGIHLENDPKITRCMFHIGENKLIQGRMYPQGNDGATDKYKETREIVQRTIAECLGVVNDWNVVKGVWECEEVTTTKGCHYPDYSNFDDCNVSYLKVNGLAVNDKRKIVIGSKHTCPSCGRRHNTQGNIECSDCQSTESSRNRSRQTWLNVSIDTDEDEEGVYCANCGQRLRDYEGTEIDGEMYCDDCVFYCDYHEEYEVRNGNEIYVENTGNYVCERGYDHGEYAYCENCDHVISTNGDEVVYIDGYWYCNHDCAMEAGYVYCNDGEYRQQDECIECERCGEYMWNEDPDIITTEDERTFCSGWCAQREGYRKCEDNEKWYKASEMVHTADNHWFRDMETAISHGYARENVEQGVA